tara:strand:+ start:3794 stop:4381 length:588 start_codon:yes stop_codon:yes gene_type:complete
MTLSDQFEGTVVLLDAEFTCWEDSLMTNWSDPSRPPEMIEIGMIAYDSVRKIELSSFTSLVKPRIHTTLSEYCRKILPITQDEVDRAPEFESVVPEIFDWLATYTQQESPTAAWGRIDRDHTASQSSRHGVVDPFGKRVHINIDELVKDSLGLSTQIEREDVRTTLGIKPVENRHRALADSADLIAFDTVLSKAN